MLRRLLLSATLAAMTGLAAQAAETVKIDTGLLKGVATEGVTSFKGIPYAAPPVGLLPWRPPGKVSNWGGVRDASDDGRVPISGEDAKRALAASIEAAPRRSHLPECK